MSSDPEFLLSCALTYKQSSLREEMVGDVFEDVETAVRTLQEVLLHEAKESFSSPLEEMPSRAHLLPVDMDTDSPGIVVAEKVGKEEKEEVIRPSSSALKRVSYQRRKGGKGEEETLPYPPLTSLPSSRNVPPPPSNREDAEAVLKKELKKAERKAATERRREERNKEKKEARGRETAEEREERLRLQREKRKEAKERKRKREEEGGGEVTRQSAVSSSLVPATETAERRGEEEAEEDVSLASVLASLPKRTKRQAGTGALSFFPTPLPHHRHLLGLQFCSVPDCLRNALLTGEESDALEIIQGPPGTGKTRELVRRVREAEGRVLLCAPTNVGAANLYARCLSEGVEGVSLLLSRQKIPLGTHVLSEDPCSRVVCCTVTGRNGPRLIRQQFDNVFLDEAGQCMEAWTWTLLRKEVRTLVLAGDVMQLPATVSETGRALRHERSLMERLLVAHAYGNTVRLHVQNRMAPEICAFPNKEFYSSSLKQGNLAPTSGSVRFIVVGEEEEGREEQIGSTYRNEGEARTISSLLAGRRGEASTSPQSGSPEGKNPGDCSPLTTSGTSCVIITPYVGQARRLLSLCTGKEVHTIDSFQGREADTVILSVVRDGSSGIGFWSEERRLVVALTRARKELIIVASSPQRWEESSALHRLWMQFG